MANIIYIPILRIVPQGGVRVLVELANDLVLRGSKVTIVTSTLNYSIPFDILSEISIIATSKYRSKYLSYVIYMFVAPFYMRKGLIIANYFITYYVSIIAATCFDGKLLYFVQGIETTKQGILGWIFNFLCRVTYHSNRIITSNQYLYDWLSVNYQVPISSIDIGISDQFFDENIVNNKKEYDVIYFARDENFKRIDRFYEIIDELSSIKFIVVSQDLNLIENIRSRQHTNVICTKPDNTAQLINYIDQAKFLLYTSEYEGFGLPPLECMARGVPAVVFHNDGIMTYCVNGYNSFVVNSVDEAVNMIVKVNEPKVLYSEISINAYNTALDYRMTDALSRMNKIIDSSIS